MGHPSLERGRPRLLRGPGSAATGRAHTRRPGGGRGPAMGARMTEPQPDRFEALYDYLDEGGQFLGQVVRKPGKVFPVRQPDGNGDWIWSWKEPPVRRVLYRLPELL